jgi:hypothetical protein
MGLQVSSRTRRLLVYGFVALVIFDLALCLSVAVFFYRTPFDPRKPDSGRYVGRTQEYILDRFGSPSHQWEGHYGLRAPSAGPNGGPVVTMTYERWTGMLYLSFEQVNGEWTCYSCDWVPNGWVID